MRESFEDFSWQIIIAKAAHLCKAEHMWIVNVTVYLVNFYSCSLCISTEKAICVIFNNWVDGWGSLEFLHIGRMLPTRYGISSLLLPLRFDLMD